MTRGGKRTPITDYIRTFDDVQELDGYKFLMFGGLRIEIGGKRYTDLIKNKSRGIYGIAQFKKVVHDFITDNNIEV